MSTIAAPSALPVVIVGAGLAGLATALTLADRRPVIVLAKRALGEAATAWAQGGVAAVLSEDDSIERHVADTQDAGVGLVDEHAARFISQRGRDAIQWLLDQGVPFDADPTGPLGVHLTREGGHALRRIAHAADATGRAIHETLLDKVRNHPGITLREHAMAIDLVTERGRRSTDTPRCVGVHVLDIARGEVDTLAAHSVVLATGGLGKVYRYTSNPDTATGDGVAMAWRAGCRVANMEFVQFHPTCLYHPEDRSFLVTEALRGEGAVLRRPDGHRFMPEHDPRAELAPRDIVAASIDLEMKRHGLDHVNLDATALGEEFLRTRFPTVHARCLALGIDIARRPIPVVPAAHYSCGGVVTDLCGATDVQGLYAVGETGCTGLHGANRLASNSLLECVVLGQAAAASILEDAGPAPTALAHWDASRVHRAREAVTVAHAWDELRLLMWNHVGIVRTRDRLERASARIRLLRDEVAEQYGRHIVDRDLLELRNLVACAELIVRCAIERRESRGLHRSLDYPRTLPAALPTVLWPDPPSA